MLRRLLLQRPLIALISSVFVVCLRRSWSSSVKVLTSWPFGRKLEGGRATRNRCCAGIQLIYAHVAVAEEKLFHGSSVFPEELLKLKGRSACSNCRRTPSGHPDPEPHGHRIQLPCTLQRPPSRLPTHFTAPTRAREEAAVPSYRSCHVTQRDTHQHKSSCHQKDGVELRR